MVEHATHIRSVRGSNPCTATIPANCTDTSNGIANNTGYLSWSDTMKWVKGLGDGLCGLTDGSSAGDWRLPTKAEWMAMVASARKQGIIPVTNSTGTGPWTYGDVFNHSFLCWNTNAWSSTTVLDDTTHAWHINFGAGDIMQTNVDKNPLEYVASPPVEAHPHLLPPLSCLFAADSLENLVL